MFHCYRWFHENGENELVRKVYKFKGKEQNECKERTK